MSLGVRPPRKRSIALRCSERPAAKISGLAAGGEGRSGAALRMTAVALGEGVRELGAKEEDLGRVVDPDQEHDQGAGGAIGRGDIALADIERDQVLAAFEQ